MNIKLTLLASVILPMGIALSACSNSNNTNANTNEQSSTETTATASQADDPVKAREDVMKNWKDAMSIMGAMMKNPDTFNADSFKTEAEFLASDADKPWQYFADESQQGGATANVWSKAEEFQAEIEKFKTATADLSAVAQSATSAEQVKEAFGKVGGSCKSCHTEFKAE